MKIKHPGWMLALCLLSACGTSLPATSENDSIVMKIEARNEPELRRDILMRLHTCKAKDVMEEVTGEEVYITAAFRAEDIPFYKVGQVGQDLLQVPGVMHVDIQGNTSVVKQPF